MSAPENPFEDLGDQGKKKPNETNFIRRDPLTEEELEKIKQFAYEGLGVNEIARKLGRSAATVSRAFKRLNIPKVIALSKAGAIVDKKLNAMETLQNNHKKMAQILEKLKTDTAENSHKYGKVLYLACESLRKDLELQLRIYQALYNVEEVSRWQNELLEVLGEVAPDVREQFYRRLQERRAI